MKAWTLPRGVLFAVALTLSTPAAARAGFEDVLPEDCLIFVGVDDLEQLEADFGKTAWGRLLADPELTSFKDWARNFYAEAGSAAEAEAGANPFELLDMISGSAACFLLDLADPDIPASGGGEPTLAFGLMVGVGDRGEDVLALIDTLLTRPIESGEAIRTYEQESGVEIAVIREVEEDERGRQEVRYAVADGTFVALMESEELVAQGRFARLLEGLAGEGQAALSQTAGFAESPAGATDGGLSMFVDLERLIGRLLELARSQGEVNEEAEAVIEALSPTDLRRLSANLTLSEEGTLVDFAIDWNGQGHILRFLQALFGRGPFQTAGLMPGELLSANLFHIDLLAALDAGLAAAREIAPEEADGIAATIEMTFQQEDFNVKDALLANLAGEVGFFTARIQDDLDALPGTEEDPQNFAVLIRLRNGSQVETALDGLLRSQGLHATRKREEFQGHTFYSMPMPFVGGKIRYAVLEDLLAISLSAELIQDVLRRHGDSNLPTLASKEEFHDSLAALGGGELTSAGYQNASASIEALIEGLSTVLSTGDFSGMGIDVDVEGLQLPSPELAKKYFEGANVSAITVDENGIRLRSSGP